MAWSEWKNVGGIELLGSERSYDLSSRADYVSLTADNFICVCDTSKDVTAPILSGQAGISYYGYSAFYPHKVNYDNTTGLLTITDGFLYSQTRTSNGFTNPATVNIPCKVYVI